jgi:hypothetical protein
MRQREHQRGRGEWVSMCARASESEATSLSAPDVSEACMTARPKSTLTPRSEHICLNKAIVASAVIFRPSGSKPAIATPVDAAICSTVLDRSARVRTTTAHHVQCTCEHTLKVTSAQTRRQHGNCERCRDIKSEKKWQARGNGISPQVPHRPPKATARTATTLINSHEYTNIAHRDNTHRCRRNSPSADGPG